MAETDGNPSADEMTETKDGRVSLGREGHPAPNFTLPTLDGRILSLSDYLGRKVIIFLWGSW